jgi:hypothetical protein
MVDAFLAAFQAHDPQNAVCVLHTVTRDFQHRILRRLRRSETYRPQPLSVEGHTFELVFDFYDANRLSRPRSSWRLECLGVQYHCFRQDAEEPLVDMTITRDHVLLWPHRYPGTDLWVQDKDQLSYTTLAALAQEHHRLVEAWIPLSKTLYLDAPDTPIQPQAALAKTHHLLASGPLPLIDGYATVLERLGVQFTIQDSPLPFMIQNTTTYQTDPSNPLALIFGRSYLVAAEIRAYLVETPHRSGSRARKRH